MLWHKPADSLQYYDILRHLRSFYAFNLGDATATYQDWFRNVTGTAVGALTLNQYQNIEGGVDGSDIAFNTKFNPSVDALGNTNVAYMVYFDGSDTQGIIDRSIFGLTMGSLNVMLRWNDPDEMWLRINDTGAAFAEGVIPGPGQMFFVRKEGGRTRTISSIIGQLTIDSNDNTTAAPDGDIYLLASNHNDTLEWESNTKIKYWASYDANPNINRVKWHEILLTLSDTINANGTGGGPNPDTTPPAGTPVIAFNTKSASNISVTVTTPSTDANPSHVNIYWDSGPTPSTTIPWGTTNYNRAGLTASTSYDIEMAWVDLAGNIGAKSNKITQTTDAGTGGGVTEVEDFQGPNVGPRDWNQWVLEGGSNASIIADDPTEGGANMVLIADIPRPATGTRYTSTTGRSEPTRRSGSADIPEFIPFGFIGSYQYRFYIPTTHDFDINAQTGSSQSSHETTMTQFKPPRYNIITDPNYVAITKPSIGIRMVNNDLKLIVRNQPDANIVKTDPNGYNQNTYNHDTNLQKGIWYYVVIDYVLHYDNTGMVKVYLKAGSFPTSADLIFSDSGGNQFNTTYSGTEGSYLKFGIYAWQWRNDATDHDDPACTSGCKLPYLGTDIGRFHLYFDDIILQNTNEF